MDATNGCDLDLESAPSTFPSIMLLQITPAAESLDFLIFLLELIVSQLGKIWAQLPLSGSQTCMSVSSYVKSQNLFCMFHWLGADIFGSGACVGQEFRETLPGSLSLSSGAMVGMAGAGGSASKVAPSLPPLARQPPPASLSTVHLRVAPGGLIFHSMALPGQSNRLHDG